ncbi:MAG: hypothetical protein F4X47_01545 [Gammaproteobacteria bacterium]|nr:hypothetical protein [Gammaproteobacteria bacterium]MYC50982.1 hypothetical protein [Gammaproteobacteria bacterium]
MPRRRSRVWAAGLSVLLAVCWDDPATTAPPAPPPPPLREPYAAERAALMALYNATGGTHWHRQGNWNTAGSIRSWQGVSTSSRGFVTGLVLSDNNLSGTIPPEIGNLTQLTQMDLEDNELTGPIPPELGDLPQLRRLVLGANELTGTIPPELGRLSQLTMLDLGRNSLSGTIPSELGRLPRLDSLLLHRNELTGPIPLELGNLASLRRLLLALNQLTGPVPPELGNLVSLTYMSLSRNQLTGTIPPELAKLSSIRILSVSRNNLTGTVPPELGSLTTLEGLYLYQNQLTGGIPVSLGNLSELETLWIHDNGLTGPLIKELADLAALEDLRAADNELSGALPRNLGRPRALARVELEGNEGLTGLLPRSMIGLEFLQTLSYGATDLCAQIDDEFQEWLGKIPDGSRTDCDVARVERFALTDLHDVTGGSSWVNRAAWGTDAPLGDWHGVSTGDGRVVGLTLPANALSGPVPAEIANLTELRVVDLAENDLSGAFPGSFAGLHELAELRLDRNPGLEGALPFGLRGLERVRVLLHDDTGLCASPAPDFQAWYAAIEQTAGAVCDNPDQVTISLPVVYLTQSVQAPSGSVRLVANRDALLRAFVTAEEPRGFFEPEVVAVFTGPEGDEVHRAVMTRAANQIPAEADEGDLELSYNAVIPAEAVTPGIEMVVEVDPEATLPLTAESRTRFPDEGSDALSVVEVPSMQLTLVPVITAEEPDTSVLAWVRGISADSPEAGLLRHAFPFAEFNVRRHEAYHTSLDLTSSAGQVSLFGELEALRASEGGTGYYYGVAANLGSNAGRGQLPGWVSVGVPRSTTLAHEVGHNLSLRHAPCGDPSGVDPAYPYPNGSIGVWGYDFRNGSTIPPDRGQDIMTYCRTLPWLSDYYFEKVIDHRAQLAAGTASAGVAAAGTASEMLVLWGGMVDGELWIDPAFPMRTVPRPPDVRGPYRILGTAADGGTLFSLDFTPGEDGHGGRHFFFTVPIEADWEEALERITLTGPEGEAYVDRADEHRVTVVSEPGTGRLRAILRDWEGALPDALRGKADLEVSMTRGLREAVRLRR